DLFIHGERKIDDAVAARAFRHAGEIRVQAVQPAIGRAGELNGALDRVLAAAVEPDGRRLAAAPVDFIGRFLRDVLPDVAEHDGSALACIAPRAFIADGAGTGHEDHFGFKPAHGVPFLWLLLSSLIAIRITRKWRIPMAWAFGATSTTDEVLAGID